MERYIGSLDSAVIGDDSKRKTTYWRVYAALWLRVNRSVPGQVRFIVRYDGLAGRGPAGRHQLTLDSARSDLGTQMLLNNRIGLNTLGSVQRLDFYVEYDNTMLSFEPEHVFIRNIGAVNETRFGGFSIAA